MGAMFFENQKKKQTQHNCKPKILKICHKKKNKKTTVYTLSAPVLHLVKPKLILFFTGQETAKTRFKFRSTAHKLY